MLKRNWFRADPSSALIGSSRAAALLLWIISSIQLRLPRSPKKIRSLEGKVGGLPNSERWEMNLVRKSLSQIWIVRGTRVRREKDLLKYRHLTHLSKCLRPFWKSINWLQWILLIQTESMGLIQFIGLPLTMSSPLRLCIPGELQNTWQSRSKVPTRMLTCLKGTSSIKFKRYKSRLRIWSIRPLISSLSRLKSNSRPIWKSTSIISQVPLSRETIRLIAEKEEVWKTNRQVLLRWLQAMQRSSKDLSDTKWLILSCTREGRRSTKSQIKACSSSQDLVAWKATGVGKRTSCSLKLSDNTVVRTGNVSLRVSQAGLMFSVFTDGRKCSILLWLRVHGPI